MVACTNHLLKVGFGLDTPGHDVHKSRTSTEQKLTPQISWAPNGVPSCHSRREFFGVEELREFCPWKLAGEDAPPLRARVLVCAHNSRERAYCQLILECIEYQGPEKNVGFSLQGFVAGGGDEGPWHTLTKWRNGVQEAFVLIRQHETSNWGSDVWFHRISRLQRPQLFHAFSFASYWFFWGK